MRLNGSVARAAGGAGAQAVDDKSAASRAGGDVFRGSPGAQEGGALRGGEGRAAGGAAGGAATTDGLGRRAALGRQAVVVLRPLPRLAVAQAPGDDLLHSHVAVDDARPRRRPIASTGGPPDARTRARQVPLQGRRRVGPRLLLPVGGARRPRRPRSPPRETELRGRARGRVPRAAQDALVAPRERAAARGRRVPAARGAPPAPPPHPFVETPAPGGGPELVSCLRPIVNRS